MKNLILHLVAAVCCIWAITAHAAKITLNPPPDVPATLDAQTFKELTARRNALLMQFGEAQGKIDSQARDCHEVEKNSPKVGECMAKAGEVKSAVRNYRAALKQFSDSLSAGAAWKQSVSSMDDKLAMSAKHPVRPIAIESHGEFHVVMADGRKLSGQEAAHLTEDDEARLITGPGGGALLTLVDGTRIKLGSGTEYLTKVSDPDPESGKQSAVKPNPNPDMGKPSVAELVKGTLRWVHEESSEMMKELNESSVQHARRSRRTLHMVHVVVAERGTEFECVVLPDGSGHIKLFSGEITVTSKLTGTNETLTHGQMITFTKDKVGIVMAIPGSV